MKKERKHGAAEGKVAILRRHLVEQASVSELGDKPRLKPTVCCRWRKEYFENGAVAFPRMENPSEHNGPVAAL